MSLTAPPIFTNPLKAIYKMAPPTAEIIAGDVVNVPSSLYTRARIEANRGNGHWVQLCAQQLWAKLND
jgi:hypothetical protein